MIFLSAQPASFYFLWQIELMLFNFDRMGITSQEIHVLIGCDQHIGLPLIFKEFIEKNTLARFFVYEDTRLKHRYESSIRPHIIAKHFNKFQYLEKETIFYHDSDIVFNHLPNFKLLLRDDFWYASDTRSYTDSKYVLSCIGNDAFEMMVSKLGIDAEAVRKNDDNMGGAQYLLKNVTVGFWQSLEIHCEILYDYLTDLNDNISFEKHGKKSINSWLTDMWCFSWLAIKNGAVIKVSQELDFFWADSKITDRLKPIIHYTGRFDKDQSKYFRKNNYGRWKPFYDDFKDVDVMSASYLLVKEIERFNLNKLESRCKLDDVTIAIDIEINSTLHSDDLITSVNYINSHFIVKIIILEKGLVSKISKELLPENVIHVFRKCNKGGHTINDLLKSKGFLKTSITVLLNNVFIVNPLSILNAINIIKENKAKLVQPYNGKIFKVDDLMRAMFCKLQKIEVLNKNLNKHVFVSSNVLFCGIMKTTTLQQELESYDNTIFLDTIKMKGMLFIFQSLLENGSLKIH